MDLVQLQYFQVLAREENMSRTAEILHVAQPAISTSLARLEKEMGTRLFDRKGKKVLLNRSGEIFLGFVDRALSDLEQTRHLLEREKNVDNQDITIASNSFMATQEMFFAYMAENPGMRLLQYSVSSTNIAKELKDENCDFVVSTVPVREQDLNFFVLMTQKIGLIVPADHPFAKRSQVELDEIKNENFVCMQQGTAFRQTTDAICKAAGFEPHVVMEYFPSQIVKAVEVSRAVALGIYYKERKLYFDTTLRFVPISTPGCTRDVTLLWKKERTGEKKIRKFIEFAKKYNANQKKEAE